MNHFVRFLGLVWVEVGVVIDGGKNDLMPRFLY